MSADVAVTTAWSQVATAANWFMMQNKGFSAVLVQVAAAAPGAADVSGFVLAKWSDGLAHDQVNGRNVYVRTTNGDSLIQVDAG